MSGFALARSARASLEGAAAARRRVAASLPGFGVAATVLGLILLTLLLGAVVALGQMQLTLFLSGLLFIVPVAILVTSQNLLPLLFIAVFVLQGTAQYFLQIRLLTWMATGMAALLFGRAVLELYNRKARMPEKPRRGAGIVIGAAVTYLAFYFFSLAMGHATPVQIISTVRFGLPMFGVLFAMYWFPWTTRRLEVLWWIAVGIMVVQLPLVVYQHFFMIAVHGWDGVVGTFGSNMSPILVIFSLAATLYLLSRWSNGLLAGWKAALGVLLFLAIVLLGEVKAVVFWIPLGTLVVMRRRVLRNLFGFITFCLFVTVFVAGTFTIYKALYWGEQGAKGSTVTEKFNSTSGYILDTNGVNYRTGEVSRGASLWLWYADPVPTVLERLVGYGPGASATSPTTGQGIVARRYGTLQLGATSVASLLWDTGVLGALAYATMLGAALVGAWRLVKNKALGAREMAIGETCLAVLVLLGTTLLYNRSLMDEPTAQLLLFFCMGCIVQLIRFPRAGAAQGAPAAQAQAAAGPARLPTLATRGATA